MKHVEWLDPDNIIIVNTEGNIYNEFITDIRSKGYSSLRMIDGTCGFGSITKFNTELAIRYVINGKPKWYSCVILQRKGNDYYISIFKYKSSEYDIDSNLEKLYKTFDRDDKLNQLLK